MRLPDRGAKPRKPADDFVAAEEAGRLAERAAAALARCEGVNWYDEHGTAIDEAAFALTRLRRAEAGLRGGPQQGDEAVRRVLGDATPEAVLWLASRALSYMDETGYPEAVEPWFQDLLDPSS